MDVLNGKSEKKGLIKKTYERCKSFAAGKGKKSGLDDDQRVEAFKRKSKSWSSSVWRDGKEMEKKCKRVVPEGCFSVYVGAEKQRFVIKTEYVNHPLFKMLLEEAESEYGYNSEGPLALPCDVDCFMKVLTEMNFDEIHHHGSGCAGFPRSPNSYHLLTTPTRISTRG